MVNILNQRALVLGFLVALGACGGGTKTVGVVDGPGAGGSGPATGGETSSQAGTPVQSTAGASGSISAGGAIEAGGSGGVIEAGGAMPAGGAMAAGGAMPAGGAMAAGGTTSGGATGMGGAGNTGPINVLVFNYTTGYGHQSRETAIPILQAAAAADTATPKINLDIKYALTAVQPEGPSDATDIQNNLPGTKPVDLSAFAPGGLDKYDVVFFLNTTGTPLGQGNNAQQQPLRDYMEKTHGGFVGTHSATDTYQGNSWPWYVDDLVGANFASHSNAGTNGSARYNDNTTHAVLTAGAVPNPWARQEEWYTLSRDIRQYKPTDSSGIFTVLLLCNDNQFPERPSAWVNQMTGGGRVFYSAFGHDVKAFQEPAFQKFLFAGIRWAAHRL